MLDYIRLLAAVRAESELCNVRLHPPAIAAVGAQSELCNVRLHPPAIAAVGAESEVCNKTVKMNHLSIPTLCVITVTIENETLSPGLMITAGHWTNSVNIAFCPNIFTNFAIQ